jgi:hypothetical protein
MSTTWWRWMFVSAAAFNFLIAGPILLAPEWSYGLAYLPPASAGALRFWGDFGFCVGIIGIGYAIVAVDTRENRGIVLLGAASKCFDVYILTTRWAAGVASPFVLVPAAIDGAYVLLFVWFLYAAKRS